MPKAEVFDMAELSLYEINDDINSEFKRIDKSSLSKHNASLLKKFYEEHYLKEGLSKSRAVKTLITLRKFAEFTGKPLDKISEEQIMQYNIRLAKEGKSQHTIMDYRKIVKCFLRFLGEKKHEWLIKSKELKCKNPYTNGCVLLPSDLPTDEEV
jgi:site-specific recombinase XerD